MKKLHRWLDAVNYQVDETELYTWECYGSGNRLWQCNINSSFTGPTTYVVFSPSTRKVYEVEVYDEGNDKVYRWIAKGYRKKLKQELKRNNVDYKDFLGLRYTEVSKFNDIIKKVENL